MKPDKIEKIEKELATRTSLRARVAPKPETQHPGPGGLPPQVGVYRCMLKPVERKRDPKHADYQGTMDLANARVRLWVWVHTDGTLGLRLAKIMPRKALTK